MSRRGDSEGVLAFAHIGDLHITDADQPNFADLLLILSQIETQARDALDFVVLPGDCADNGKPGQYALIATALRMLSIPVHVIPGDHDMEQGDLSAFYKGLGAAALPNSLRVKGHRCLFLDFCGAGRGGPDFQLGEAQMNWLATQLDEATAAAETPVIFMHSYPSDLRGAGETDRLSRLIADHAVALVDMGHTHYNELANDGVTIFAATRSTGQREEGPVGYSVATVHDGIVSWRFRPLDDPFPFVMITAPADHRLCRGEDHRVRPGCEVSARVFGREAIAQVDYQIDDGEWVAMTRKNGGSDWTAPLQGGDDRLVDITVRAVTESGRPGLHAIRAAGPSFTFPEHRGSGSDAAAIGAWPENGIYGTQLGPNRNGRKW